MSPQEFAERLQKICNGLVRDFGEMGILELKVDENLFLRFRHYVERSTVMRPYEKYDPNVLYFVTQAGAVKITKEKDSE